MARDSDLDIGATVVVALVGALLTIALVIAVQAFYYRTEDREFQEAYAQPDLQVVQVKTDQLQLLTRYSLPEGGKGTIRIPIDRAMELIAQRGLPAPKPERGQSK